MQKARGASGSDLIPNKTFWFALPGLIKVHRRVCVSACSSIQEGARFTVALVTRRSYQRL
jgi:hypothetical protein